MSQGARAVLRPGLVSSSIVAMRVLIIEDDPDLASAVAQAVRESGMSADVAPSGPEGLRLAVGFDYAAVLLDLLLPGLHGLAVLRELRRVKPRQPILVLSALDQVEERVDGLDRGADDYLPKPFAMTELLARLRSVVRRATLDAPSSLVRIGALELDLARRSALRDGRPLNLTPREYALLMFLVARRGRVVTREEIGKHVIDRAFEPSSNAIDVSVCGLRHKIGDPDYVTTVRGVGYRFEAPGAS